LPVVPSDLVRFENVELDSQRYSLRRSGRNLKLERIPVELLLFLVERRGLLVTREEIIEKLWGKDVFLDNDNSINNAIRKIRQALKDDPEQLALCRPSRVRDSARLAGSLSRPVK
jgi:DNA-binding winged helix-turn-helix (wHTH) protein